MNKRRQAEPYEVRLALAGLRNSNYRNVGGVRRLAIRQGAGSDGDQG